MLCLHIVQYMDFMFMPRGQYVAVHYGFRNQLNWDSWSGGITHFRTCCPTFIGGYTVSSPSDLPALMCSVRSCLALLFRTGIGIRS